MPAFQIYPDDGDVDDPHSDEQGRILIRFDRPLSEYRDEAQNQFPREIRDGFIREFPNLSIDRLFPQIDPRTAPPDFLTYYVVTIGGGLESTQEEIERIALNLSNHLNKKKDEYPNVLETSVEEKKCEIPLFHKQAPDPLGMMYAHNCGHTGQGIKLCIMERVWHTGVIGETFYQKGKRKITFTRPTNCSNIDYDKAIAHSTATLGILAANCDTDATGLIGMTRGIEKIIGYTPVNDCIENWAESIKDAATLLSPGDVLLLEGQAYHRSHQENDPKYIPLEYGQAEVRDAIKAAVDQGIIVIEPAGNGKTKLDDETWVDTGAIVVGASTADVTPDIASNFGERVDLFAWGTLIKTTIVPWADFEYNSTSGSAALIAGVAVLAQSAVVSCGKPPLDSRQMRDSLKKSGKPVKGIGCMPNLEKFIKDIIRTLPGPPCP